MQIVANEKGILVPKKATIKLAPAFFSVFAFLLVVLGGISVISLQDQLKNSQDVRNQAYGTSEATCKISGCSSELCVESSQGGLSSTCVYQEKYSCYQTAECKRQSSGQCGWTQTTALQTCLNNYTTTYATGDFNHDGSINLLDYTMLVNEFLKNQTSYQTDMNADGKVNLTDYTLFVQKL